jgi:hypothetical protein
MDGSFHAIIRPAHSLKDAQPNDMNNTPSQKNGDTPDLEHLNEALAHVDAGVHSGKIAVGAAKGLLYGLIEALGVLVGDPDLPEHARSGYEGLLEVARELRVKLDR